jgi:hypothetical protein
VSEQHGRPAVEAGVEVTRPRGRGGGQGEQDDEGCEDAGHQHVNARG